MNQPKKIVITAVNHNGKEVAVAKYYLQEPFKDLGGGKSSGPYYRKGFRKHKPMDPLYLPDLAFTLGHTDKNPIMHPTRP